MRALPWLFFIPSVVHSLHLSYSSIGVTFQCQFKASIGQSLHYDWIQRSIFGVLDLIRPQFAYFCLKYIAALS